MESLESTSALIYRYYISRKFYNKNTYRWDDQPATVGLISITKSDF